MGPRVWSRREFFLVNRKKTWVEITPPPITTRVKESGLHTVLNFSVLIRILILSENRMLEN